MTFRARRQSDEGAQAFGSEDVGGRHRRHRIQFFTIDETAEMLRVATRTVRRRIAAGELIAHRFGGAVRIAESDLRAFLAIHPEC